MINIDFLNNQEEFDTKPFEDIVFKVAEETFKIHNIEKEAEISVVFTDDEAIKEINKNFRNIDSSTDVLSFPQYEFFEEGDISHIEDNVLILGDIIISLEHAKAQSVEFNHSLNREVGYLTAHSMLHLLGYDHMEEEEKARMRKKEEQIMTNVKLTRED